MQRFSFKVEQFPMDGYSKKSLFGGGYFGPHQFLRDREKVNDWW